MGIAIVDFAEAPKTNEYTETVKALAEAGEGKAVTITEDTREAAFRERGRFGEAARIEGFSTRVKADEEKTDGKGNVTSVSITLVLVPKITRTRKPKGETADADQTVSDSETE